MAFLCVFCVVIMVLVLCTPKKEKGEFIPPPFEVNAVSGVPTVDERFGYGEIYRNGMAFSAWICGNVTIEGNNARLYFTNPPNNTVWLKIRIMDTEGSILGESGILKPGEYVELVTLGSELDVGTKISLKIMAYEAETYRSEGAVVLNTAIGKK